jgi:VanZ family protein
VLVSAWSVGAAFVFLFPFDFDLSGDFVRSRLARVPRVLFASYYFGSEYNAVTQVLRKMLYFLPLGAIVAWGFGAVRPGVQRVVYALSAAVVIVAAAVGLEAAQLALPGKIVDPTDAVLACCGALVGWMLVSWVVQLGRPAKRRYSQGP